VADVIEVERAEDGAVAKIPTAPRGQVEHILDIALDGLRYWTPGEEPRAAAAYWW
jgi:hypothetical protein